ncbi:MAG: hypothetical protein JO323_24715 [Acidobacteriia bacterium]|nr:hypothetical protein [Terriglobia bacterium]
MAKGWESKSVEALAGVYQSIPRPAGLNTPDAATLDRIRQKETILLSRTRIMTQLQSAENPRYRELLNRSLVDLDAKLAAL